MQRGSAQQESGAALSKNSMFMAGAKIIYSYYTRCALIIKDRQPTAWDDFAHPAEAEATCIRKVSHQIVSSKMKFL